MKEFTFIKGSLLAGLVLFSLISAPTWAENQASPPKEGNLSMPSSNQPAPLISFGQNILNQHQAQFTFLMTDYSAINSYAITATPSLLYGITDNFSLFLNAPYSDNKLGSYQSKGFQDAFAQVEYAYYNGSTDQYESQATIVGNMSVPTGSVTKNPPTGNGAPTFFLGTTYSRTYVDWWYFLSPGATFTTAKNGTKIGNSYLYQFGCARMIARTENWLFDWMLEADGTYSQKNRLQGVLNANTGGNVFYLTPSIWASTKTFFLQLGAGYAVAQHLFGNQPRESYLLALNLGLTLWR